MKTVMTLCFIQKGQNVLLGMKKRGFGKGKWNGFGGKVKENESIEDAALRELKEEVDISVKEMTKQGILEFEFNENPGNIFEVHIFKTEEFEGVPKESEEMRPQWFSVNNLPLKEMWLDDKYWFPLFFNEKKFLGNFLFEGDDNIIKYTLNEVEEII